MLLDVQVRDGFALATINTKRIEARIADELSSGLIEAFKTARGATIDFSQVGFIDSTGMKALMTVLLHCRKTEVACALYGVSEDIMSVFVITRLNRLLPITDNAEEALDHVRDLVATQASRGSAAP